MTYIKNGLHHTQSKSTNLLLKATSKYLLTYLHRNLLCIIYCRGILILIGFFWHLSLVQFDCDFSNYLRQNFTSKFDMFPLIYLLGLFTFFYLGIWKSIFIHAFTQGFLLLNELLTLPWWSLIHIRFLQGLDFYFVFEFFVEIWHVLDVFYWVYSGQSV